MKIINKKVIAIIAILMFALSTIFGANLSYAAEPTYEVKISTQNEQGKETGGPRTYNAYKIFDIVSGNKTDGFEYKIVNLDAFKKASGDNTISDIFAAINYLKGIENNKVKLNEFAKNYATAIGENGKIEGTANSNSISLEKGYYLITDTKTVQPYSKNLLLNVDESLADENNIINANVKADVISIPEKTANKKSAKIGDEVDFKIESDVPDVSGYDSYKYDIVDTPSNLSIIESSIKVYLNNEQTDITENATIELKNNKLTVSLGNYLIENKTTLTQGKFIVKYTAILENGAITENKANNSAEVHYGPNPDTQKEGKTDTTTETVYSYSVQFTKTDLVGNPLNGVEFSLKKGNDIINVSKKDNYYIVNKEGTDVITTQNDGKFRIEGLDAGTYTLTETKPLEGYKQFTYTFTINDDNGVSLTDLGASENGKIRNDYIKGENTTITDLSKVNDDLTATLVNATENSILPGTGGIGTKIFTVVGIVIMAGAVIAIIKHNKKEA